MLVTSLTASFASSDDQDETALANAHWQMWQYYAGPADLFGEFTASAFSAALKCSYVLNPFDYLLELLSLLLP
jgi:hypothetical protein